mmetsp:Transcript_5782/g.15980  ORF Transcript_5782/g.15980 Transcript_5782/m.15980 type:complete len:281 (-) Transcript_5782:164-1006(-)
MLGSSGSIQDCGSSSKEPGSTDRHDFVVKNTFVHVPHELGEEPRVLQSSRSEPSLSSRSAASSSSASAGGGAARGRGDSRSIAGGRGSRASTGGKGGGRGDSSSSNGGRGRSDKGDGRGGSSSAGGRGHSRGHAPGSSETFADGASSSQASGSKGVARQALHASHAKGTCVQCGFIVQGKDCPNKRRCQHCHDPQHQIMYRARRPCKGKRERYQKVLLETMMQITNHPDSFDIDTFELPQSVNDNALYREKFLERIRVHQEWVRPEHRRVLASSKRQVLT